MSKRRVDEEDSDIDVSSTDSEGEEIQQEEIVDVDFEFFDLNPDIDFLATKNLLRQLFGDDANNFNISGIADLFLTENSIGTTIKTDGKESDPYALLSVININEQKDKAPMKTLLDYIFEKTSKSIEFNMMLKKLINTIKTTKDSSKLPKVGLIISERVVNMPVEVAPPMYKMLLEEMEKSEENHEKYEFDYFLIISKVYKLVGSTLDDEDKKSKKKKSENFIEMDYFHYEDMIFEENSMYHGYFDYTNVNQVTDSRRVFTEYGIDPKLSLMLLSKDNLAKSVPAMAEKFPPF
ncbi:protein Bcp1p [[Candida] jaroonii]|uniref:Protein Bcp1p n=1 Tax=[Candida] jaroonii TaxID=467808 RepID=A0ACA9YEE5_9ASCO|nr:protein Bcp1p [[Candida] jaroonii]